MFRDTPKHSYVGSVFQAFVLIDLISKTIWACPEA